ncbi:MULTISPECIES: YtjB family periplasmic protein [Photobacterium]|uniref:YtjB family periplasmic protein n=1 Tax=Photobacterium TaxID=657 RepID=UPI001C2DC154|nr:MULTISPECIES: AhpA/YtjB family protein [Photobacterium]MBV1839028.1 YtjB family periplasmic protein [Photobacterium ganghwense]
MKLKKSRFQRAWQLFVVFSCLAALFTMLEYGSDLTKRNYRALSEQTQQLSRLAIRQAAETASLNLVEKNHDPLQALAEQLSREPLILDATIYDLEGVTLAQTEDAMPLEQVTGLSTPLSVASIGRQQLVEPVMNQDQVVGYIRITLEHDQLLADTLKNIDYVTNVIRGLIIAALAIGFLLAFTFGRRKDIWHFPFLLSANKPE